MPTITHNGIDYPVTDAWDALNNTPFPGLASQSRDQLRALQDDLMTASNSRALSADEIVYLAAANNHFDVRTAIDFLGGRSHTDFGFTGVDQVHGNRQTFPCRCQLHVVFDHSLLGKTSSPTLHPHTPRYVCGRHASLTGNLIALHAKVIADNRPVAV